MRAVINVQWMTRNGVPTGCPECNGLAMQFSTTQPFDGWPSNGWCRTCSHCWEDVLITNGVVRLILANRTGRAKATDADTFEITAPGQRLQGELVPELVADDIRQLGKVLWKRVIKPAVRKKKNAAKRAAKKAVVGGAKKAIAAPKAAVLTAAWTARAGGFEDAPGPEVDPCPAGCEGGFFELDSAVHAGDAAFVKCSFCHGTGERP